MKVCVIDIGTNSIHALFAEIHSTGAFRVSGKEKEMVRLGDGAMVTGRLSQKSMAKALSALKRFHHLAKHRKVERIIATATSAVRESENGGEFLDLVRKETGLKIQVITGTEEGRLISLAVRNTLEFSPKRVLIIDIGGGSAEFIAATQKESLWISSLPLGSNRLSQMFPVSNTPKKSEIKNLEEHIQDTLKPVLKKIQTSKIDFIVGTSGTILSLVKMVLSSKAKTPAHKIGHTALINTKQVTDLYHALVSKKTPDRVKMKGFDKNRTDMMIQGSAVIATVLQKTKLPGLIVCDKALREGILYDFIEKNRARLKIENDIPELRRRNVMLLAALATTQKPHGEHVARIALQLFDKFKSLHGLNKFDRELLEYAALLHDVGYHISFHRHHKHTHYLITNTELNGFTPEEIQVLAWTARLHRRSTGKKDSDFAKLAPTLQRRILKLAAFLRLADALDHSHFGLVKSLSAKTSGNTFVISVKASVNAQWEIYEAMQRRPLFEKMFGKKLDFKMS